MHKTLSRAAAATAAFSCLLPCGCKSPYAHRREADKAAYQIIREKQQAALNENEPFTIEKPADTLRRRLMLGQNLIHSDPASVSTKDIQPIKRFPDRKYLGSQGDVPDPSGPTWQAGPLRLTLLEALQVAAHNSRTYQAQKEAVYIQALSLDLERDEFRTTWSGLIDNTILHDRGGDDPITGLVTSPSASVLQRFKAGAIVTGRIALDLVKLLSGDRASSRGIAADFSVTIPLLQGAGREIFTENLTQAERDVIYQLWDFDQFKRQFTVQIASQYFAVLQSMDSVENNEQSYRRLIINARRSRRLADAGRLPEIQVDQALQEELRGRDRWISSRQTLAQRQDNFKVLLGLPPDAEIEFDRGELRRVSESVRLTLDIEDPNRPLERQSAPDTQPVEPAATQPAAPAERPQGGYQVDPVTELPRPGRAATGPAPGPEDLGPTAGDIVLREPSPEGGPYEIPEDMALKVALEQRPDLKAFQGAVIDAQRRVYVAADALRAGLDLTAGGSFGGRRGGLGSANQPNAQLRPERGSYDAGLLLEVPLERTGARNAYRQSLIALERATRALQEAEDEIKLDVRSSLRDLLGAREGLQTQARAVAVANRRIRGADLNLLAGRASVRDVLEAQNAIVTAQNSFTAAVVEYRVAELELQRDMGVLDVNHEGQWREYVPPEPPPGARPTTLPGAAASTRPAATQPANVNP
jgi:outer membrane protein TolC